MNRGNSKEQASAEPETYRHVSRNENGELLEAHACALCQGGNKSRGKTMANEVASMKIASLKKTLKQKQERTDAKNGEVVAGLVGL